jgi:hypothetical protein
MVMGQMQSGRWRRLIRRGIVWSVALMVNQPFPGPAADESWQSFHGGNGGAVYAWSPASLVRAGDQVEVWVRTLEAPETGAERMTTIRYRLDCRQGTFRILEVVEERGTERSVCTTVSDAILIRPQKHGQVATLREKFCF